MSYFRKTHELHDRRAGRNMGVLAVLLGVIVIVFGLTVVKVTSGGSLEGFDHVVRPQMVTEG